MKKIVLTITALAVMLIAGTAFGQTTADMIAGNPKNPPPNIVGEVTVERVGDTLVVTYDSSGYGWKILGTHLHISEDDGDGVPYDGKKPDSGDGTPIPLSGGNPPPGQFAFSDPSTSTDTFVQYIIDLVGTIPGEKKNDDPVPYDWATDDLLHVAAHAGVELDCLDYLELMLPDEVNMEILRAAIPGQDGAYFPELEITGPTDPTSLDGIYPAWCLDPYRVINKETVYPAIGVYSTYEILPEDLVEKDENLPCVNWILNNIEVGDLVDNGLSACDEEPYTIGDIQLAIWILLWDEVPVEAVESLEDDGYDPSPCRVEEIIRIADCDFEPECCTDDVGVIIVPRRGPEGSQRYWQPVLIKIPTDCGDETAWAGEPDPSDNVPGPEPDDGDGYQYEFLGSNWAMYIKYTVE